jgi:hypothetical protein
MKKPEALLSEMSINIRRCASSFPSILSIRFIHGRDSCQSRSGSRGERARKRGFNGWRTDDVERVRSTEYGVRRRLEGGKKRNFETRKRNRKSGVSKGKKRK